MKVEIKERQFPNLVYNAHTGENANLVRIHCKCGHSLNFLSNHPKTCTFCGSVVYPTQECEFREKIKKMIRRNNE